MAPNREAKLNAVLRRQHGVFSWDQAESAGFSPQALARAVGQGRFRRPLRAVYADTAFARTRHQDAMAAVLACGGNGVVSSRLTAAGLWIAERGVPATPQVTVLVPRDPKPYGVDVVRTRHMNGAERTSVLGIPVTSPMRTLVDIAALVDADDLELVLDELWRRKLVTPERLLGYLDSATLRACKGSDILRTLCRLRAGLVAPGSAPETLFLRLVRRFRLPIPTPQLPVHTPYGVRYLDFAYEEHKLAIELDALNSRLRDRRAFDDFLVRQNLVEQQGWTFRRFTNTQIVADPVMVVVTLANALGLVPASWRVDTRRPAR